MKKIRRGCIPLKIRYYWGCTIAEWSEALLLREKLNEKLKNSWFTLALGNPLKKYIEKVCFNQVSAESSTHKRAFNWGDLSFYMTEGNVSFHCTWCHEMFLEQAELYIELHQSKSLLLDAVLPDMMLEISRFHLRGSVRKKASYVVSNVFVSFQLKRKRPLVSDSLSLFSWAWLDLIDVLFCSQLIIGPIYWVLNYLLHLSRFGSFEFFLFLSLHILFFSLKL